MVHSPVSTGGTRRGMGLVDGVSPSKVSASRCGAAWAVGGAKNARRREMGRVKRRHGGHVLGHACGVTRVARRRGNGEFDLATKHGDPSPRGPNCVTHPSFSACGANLNFGILVNVLWVAQM